MADNPPRVLAGRYEVGELIGRGGMAEVHIGHDSRLGRTVAIKILRSDLARDPTFLARFRREAQAAASLNHPAIVAVYDTGEDEFTDPVSGQQMHIPFIVMEYVEGHTVRDILTHGTAVPIDEAVEITMGVLSALEYSHHAGIVHRDIKPGNVMITPTGAVKVMDFGIARAVAGSAATMTQTQAVIGTAQYLSPEQARGETVDARSDLYSTGCLLFELLTGRPPFVGDSPVAVAYQHVGQKPVPPSELASDIPEALDQITLKALAKERETRYSSAAEFREDLERFLVGQEPLAAIGAVGMGITGAPTTTSGPMPTVPLQSATNTRAMPGIAATQVVRPNLGPSGQPTVAFNSPDTVAFNTPGTAQLPRAAQQSGATTQFIAPADFNAPPTGTVPPTRAMQQAPAWNPVTNPQTNAVPVAAPARRSRAWLGVLIPVLVLGLGFLAWQFMSGGFGGVGGDVAVPTLPAGVTRAEAERIITDAHLRFVDQLDPDSDLPPDTFVRQDPEGGTEVPRGSDVTVFFAAGPNSFQMPDLAGMTQGEARQTLRDLGLEIGSVEPETSARIPRNNVTRSIPAAFDPVQRGGTVDIFISNGLVDLPDLLGMTQADAIALLNSDELGLRSNTREAEDANATPGTVIRQSPGAGQVEQGSTVELTIAVSPRIQQVPVPTVVGLPWTSQTQDLFTQNNLTAQVQEAYSDSVPSGSVISTNPAGGTMVNPGTAVMVIVSRGPQQVAPPPVETPTTPPVTEEPPVDPGDGGGDEYYPYDAATAYRPDFDLEATEASTP